MVLSLVDALSVAAAPLVAPHGDERVDRSMLAGSFDPCRW
jgi:hypothetical protein